MGKGEWQRKKGEDRDRRREEKENAREERSVRGKKEEDGESMGG